MVDVHHYLIVHTISHDYMITFAPIRIRLVKEIIYNYFQI